MSSAFYKILRLVPGFLLCVASLSCFAQIEPGDEDLSFRKLLRKGDLLYYNGSYYNAASYYDKAIKLKSDHLYAKHQLAMSYYYSRDYRRAESLFKEVYEADPDFYKLDQYYHALMMKMNGKYESAKDQFKAFGRGFKPKGPEETKLKKQSRAEYQGCELAIELKKDTANIRFDLIGPGNINQHYTEFGPLPTDNGLIFGSLRIEDSTIVLKEKESIMPKSKLYYVEKKGKNWGRVQQFKGPFNDDESHTGQGAYSPDGKRFYFSRCSDERGSNLVCDLFVSVFVDGEWSQPEPLPLNTEEYDEKHPNVVEYARGEYLYFVSNREGGQGGQDIWYVQMQDKGTEISEPQNVGRRINSTMDEITPFYDTRDTILYFSSNGGLNVGGFDVFMSKGEGRRWAKPINLGFPINSSVDDFGYMHQDTGKSRHGYLVSNRIGSIGFKSETCCDDIWHWEYYSPPKFYISGLAKTNPDSTGKTILSGVSIQLKELGSEVVLDSAVTDEQGRYVFFVGAKKDNFRIEGRKKNFIVGVTSTSTVGLTETDTVYGADLFLKDLSKFGKVVLKNVYFDFNKDKIREDAKPSLDTIYQIMTENPNIIIELSSHTDSRGNNEYNKKLSQRRANSSRNYLIEKGIQAERIIAVGYGEEQLLNDCHDNSDCSQIEHQLNRRTEFRIIGELDNIVIYDKREIDAIRKMKEQGAFGKKRINWDFESPPEEYNWDMENIIEKEDAIDKEPEFPEPEEE